MVVKELWSSRSHVGALNRWLPLPNHVQSENSGQSDWLPIHIDTLPIHPSTRLRQLRRRYYLLCRHDLRNFAVSLQPGNLYEWGIVSGIQTAIQYSIVPIVIPFSCLFSSPLWIWLAVELCRICITLREDFDGFTFWFSWFRLPAPFASVSMASTCQIIRFAIHPYANRLVVGTDGLAWKTAFA